MGRENRFDRARKAAGLVMGPVIFIIVLCHPHTGGGQAAHRLLAILSLVVIFWITEAIPIPVTALLGSVLAVIGGVAPAREVFAPYGDQIIFLFIGAFIIAKSMTVHGLDRRFASVILRTRRFSSSPWRVIVSLGIITMVLSMWMSNTAAAAMMMPFALCLLDPFRGEGEDKCALTASGTLVVAYAASVGGMATPVGTPPNLITLAFLRDTLNIRLPFFRWMLVGIPLSLVLFALILLVLRLGRGTCAPVRQVDLERCAPLDRSPLSRGAKNTLTVFGVVVLLWVIPGFLSIFLGTQSRASAWYEARVPEAVVALLGAIALFFLPVNFKEREFTITWEDASRINWGTILLFGGGLSLGTLMFKTGLGDAFGQAILRFTGAATLWELTLISIIASVIITEITSNTATANIMIPVAISLAKTLNVPLLPPVLGACFGASMGLMLPISTPPNAIAYATGMVTITRMIATGVALDIAGIGIIFLVLRISSAAGLI